MHYYFEKNGRRLSLVGTVITLFDKDGHKIKQWFYESKWEAKKVFLAVVGQGDLFKVTLFYCAKRQERKEY